MSTKSNSTDSRRQFMRKAGLTAAVATIAGPAAALPFADTDSPLQNDDQRKVGFAIVGLGKYAQEQMMPAFKESKHAKITALVSGSPEKMQQLAKQYSVDAKSCYSYQNFDSIKDNPAVDVVYIVLPPGLHAEYVVRAAQAGKHVLTEKPMATSVADCQRMIDACRKAGKQLMVAYRAQYEPFNLDAIARIKNGELGKLRYVTSDHGRQVEPSKDKADEWRVVKKLAGGGSLMDIGIYSLNAARYLTGEEPVEVMAMESTDRTDPRFKEVEDQIHFTLRFPSGVLATCTSAYSIETVKRLRAFGEKAYLDLDPATDYYKHNMTIGTAEGEMKPAVKEGNQFAAELDHMAECVLQNKTPKTPGEEGLRDIKLIMALYESAKKGKPVKV
ncbi:Gfo/Idh/MocA family oxidoreductase [Hymenobacter sp. BT683]|uniref:Gfo/Idh/MocA family oxidoreductase n=1 Tax=Hymenobacter jeongseonensis TaxID=2791027 RepID=A0ABS0IJV3_9BACT|nr:Gfo/Idh/MocA family oxidoreductase [Hymenobacter jeongseonensis]MBF9238309.1 Gfo/Idh/MocA family oxidoreductase [Hymenobacter jeongseonensis]